MSAAVAYPLPTAPSGLTTVTPSYLFVQYNDDDALQAFIGAYNAYAQSYLDTFNALNLPVYTNGGISGALLDWVAAGLYGMLRPGLPTTGVAAVGPYNSYVFNSGTPYNGYVPGIGQTYIATSDDVFKRVLTWAFYKGDGRQTTVRWLKRRVYRFLNGANGVDVSIVNTYTISIRFTGPYAATISVPNSPIAVVFRSAVSAGILELPFQIAWTITLV